MIPASLTDRIRRGEDAPFPLSMLLHALTPATRLAMCRRARLPRTRVEAHVISLGNITTGGTGKTPAVIERSRQELGRGRCVAVLTRGYGTPNPKDLIVARGRDGLKGLARRIGDEPALIARKVPEAWILRCADRCTAAHAAVNQYGCDCLILDDGFQYLPLERDENIVLIDAVNPFGSEYLLPRGILREPLTGLHRATHFVLTRCDRAPGARALMKRLELRFPDIPIRTTRHAPMGLWRLRDGYEAGLNWLRGRRVHAVCAIAQPESFWALLEELGAQVGTCQAFPDHAAIPRAVLEAGDPVVMTEKDAARIEDAPDGVWALSIDLEDYAIGPA